MFIHNFSINLNGITLGFFIALTSEASLCPIVYIRFVFPCVKLLCFVFSILTMQASGVKQIKKGKYMHFLNLLKKHKLALQKAVIFYHVKYFSIVSQAM